jgi:rubrerythrin
MINKIYSRKGPGLLELVGKIKPPVPEIKTFGDVVDFAIHEETKAYVCYMTLAGRVKHPWTRKALEGFAADEVRHIDRLVEIKQTGGAAVEPEDVPDLRIGDYVTADISPREDMDTREAYIFAIRAEEAAARFYGNLAAKAVLPEVKEVLLALAQEEAKHKLKLETEYDDRVLAQN